MIELNSNGITININNIDSNLFEFLHKSPFNKIIEFDTDREYHKNELVQLANYNVYNYNFEYPEYAKCYVKFNSNWGLTIKCEYNGYYHIGNSKCRWLFKKII